MEHKISIEQKKISKIFSFAISCDDFHSSRVRVEDTEQKFIKSASKM